MLMGGVQIGGNETGGIAPQRDGDEIQIGTDMTPYRYSFIVEVVRFDPHVPG